MLTQPNTFFFNYEILEKLSTIPTIFRFFLFSISFKKGIENTALFGVKIFF